MITLFICIFYVNTWGQASAKQNESTAIQYNSWQSATWLRNVVSYIKGRMQDKGIWKQNPEATIWAQERWEWGVDKARTRGTS